MFFQPRSPRDIKRPDFLSGKLFYFSFQQPMSRWRYVAVPLHSLPCFFTNQDREAPGLRRSAALAWLARSLWAAYRRRSPPRRGPWREKPGGRAWSKDRDSIMWRHHERQYITAYRKRKREKKNIIQIRSIIIISLPVWLWRAGVLIDFQVTSE